MADPGEIGMPNNRDSQVPLALIGATFKRSKCGLCDVLRDVLC